MPALRRSSRGTTWGQSDPKGTTLDISRFYVVKPGASTADINDALRAGQHLLVTPGVFDIDQPIRIERVDTVVLGPGLATLVPHNGVTALQVADVDGVKIAGLLIDAGSQESARLMQIGPDGANADHADNPTSINDVFLRVGGNHVGRAHTAWTSTATTSSPIISGCGEPITRPPACPPAGTPTPHSAA